MSFNPGDVVTVDFPGVQEIKRRPAVVSSSSTYHATLHSGNDRNSNQGTGCH